MGPDLVLGHAHQACDDGHLLLRISRKVLRSRNGLLDRGRFMAHPRWTGDLGQLGSGAHRREHDRTLPDHVVFVQCSISRAGLRQERGSARSRPWVGARGVPVNSSVMTVPGGPSLFGIPVLTLCGLMGYVIALV